MVIKQSEGKGGKVSLAGMLHFVWANLEEICGEQSFLG